MIFELTHQDITQALKEFMNARGIINGKDFTFQMKTSRKGEKTSKAIITTVDVVATPVVVAPVVEAVAEPVVSSQMELPLEVPQVVVVEEPVVNPFKKLFAE